jgi:hypothetical protein
MTEIPRQTDRNGEIPVENLDMTDPVDVAALALESYRYDYRPVWRVCPFGYKRAQFVVEQLRKKGFLK